MKGQILILIIMIESLAICFNSMYFWSDRKNYSLSEGFPGLPGPLVIQHIQEGCLQTVRICCIVLTLDTEMVAFV